MTESDLPITSDDVLEWSRRALPPANASLLETLIDALPCTDVDVRHLEHPAARTFRRRSCAGVLLEETSTTESAARPQLKTNPMHVDAYLDGVPLYDRDGALARLEAVR